MPGPETLTEPDQLPRFSLSQTRCEACPPLSLPNPRTTHPGQPLAAPQGAGEGNAAVHHVLTRCGCSAHRDWKGWGWEGWSPTCFPGRPYRWRHLQNSCSLHTCPSLIFPGPFSESGGKKEALEGPPQLLSGSLGRREQGLSGVWRGEPQLESLAGATGLGLGREAACLSPPGLGTAWVPSPWRHWLTLAPQDVTVLPVLHPLLGQGSQTRVPPQPILYRVPTCGRKPVLDKYSMHAVNKQMHEGDIHGAGTRTPEALAPRTPDSGARSWERPVAHSPEGQNLRTGLTDLFQVCERAPAVC